MADPTPTAAQIAADEYRKLYEAEKARADNFQVKLEVRTAALVHAIGLAQDSTLPCAGTVDRWREAMGWHKPKAAGEKQ